jgi:hypothetical protein
MTVHTFAHRLCATAMVVMATGCSTAGTSVTGPSDGAFRLISAQITKTEYEMLEVTLRLTNTGTTPLRSGGCMRPDVAIDAQTAGVWSPIDILQTAELVVCIQAYTLAPGTTGEFTTAFRRAKAADLFPRDTPLRLRVVLQSGAEGPVLPISIR